MNIGLWINVGFIFVGALTVLVGAANVALELYKLRFFDRFKRKEEYTGSARWPVSSVDRWRAWLSGIVLVGLGLFIWLTFHYRAQLENPPTSGAAGQVSVESIPAPHHAWKGDCKTLRPEVFQSPLPDLPTTFSPDVDEVGQVACIQRYGKKTSNFIPGCQPK